MKKRILSRLLAAFLAVMLMAQSLCLTAFAEETTLEATSEAVTETEPENEPVNEAVIEEPVIEEPEVEEPEVEEPEVEEPETKSEVIPVNIPADSSVEQVNRILTTAILGESTETKNWEYHCKGKTSLGISGNASWGSIEGFTSEVITTLFGKKYTTTYTHPALANNDDGVYKVRAAGAADTVYTIEKSAKLQGSITLQESPSAALNSADLKSAIFSAVVASSTPAGLTADAVTMEYYATPITGAVGSIGMKWVPLEGEKVGSLTTYPAIGLGEHKVRISWSGNAEYAGFKTESKIQITSGKQVSSIKLNPDATVSMVYGENVQPDIAATKAAIFAAVVASYTPAELPAADVTMEYYAASSFTGVSQNWAPLEGGKVSGINYPAIGLGQQQIRISWGGNEEYDGFSAETTITLTERPTPEYKLNKSPNIKLVYNDDLAVDYENIESAVFNAIVESADFSAEDVSIEYYATATTGSAVGIGQAWVPLTGGKGNEIVPLTYPAISEGTWSIHIIYPGSQTLAPVTITQDLVVRGREPMQFNLKEGPYAVGMVFNEQQGYDFAATAKAIYEAVVESTVPTLNFEEVKVEFNILPSDKIPSYQPLDYAVAGKTLFRDGTWSIRISWGGSKEYTPGYTVVSVTTTDNRIDSQIALKSDASFTYNMDVTAMKQAVLDNVIDWNASTLPAKETLSLEDFTFEYKASLSILDGVEGELVDKLLEQLKNNGALDAKVYVPFEGKNYDIGGQTIAKYPQIGAGVQSIRVTYKGSAEYKPSNPTEGSITVNKAKVKVHVKSASMYVSEAANGLNLVTTTPDDHFNTFVVYAGVTRNVTSAVYLQLPESYTSNQVLIKLLDKALEGLGQPTFTEMMQNGITLGQLRQLLKTKEIVDVLEKIGIDTGALGQLIKVIDKLPAVGDNLRIAVGVPNRAGAYSVTAITDNKNYNVGVGVGALVLKADKAKLVWKQTIGKKISAADAKSTVFAAELQKMNGEAVPDQSSVQVLYSGFTSKWKVYSSTTTPPTEPGRYVMTVVVLGGNYQAAPITRSFQITK